METGQSMTQLNTYRYGCGCEIQIEHKCPPENCETHVHETIAWVDEPDITEQRTGYALGGRSAAEQDEPIRPEMVKADTLEESIRLTQERNERDMKAQIGAFSTGVAGASESITGQRMMSERQAFNEELSYHLSRNTTWNQPEPLTLEQAVAVLNERKHNGMANWERGRVFTDTVEGGDDILTDFEAIACAEKYEREGK